jgi:protein RecA
MAKAKNKEEVKEVSPLEALTDNLSRTLVKTYSESILPSAIEGSVNIPWVAYNMLIGSELGTIMEVYGEFASGKSILMMMMGAAVQQAGGLFMCYNTEAANRDKVFLEKVCPGLDYDKIMFFQPDTIEEVFNCIQDTVNMVPKDGPTVFIGIDSISACASKHEMDNPMEKADMSRAKMTSKGLRRLCSPLSKKPIILFMISQKRVEITTYGAPSKVTGGKALEYYPSTMLNIALKKDILNDFKVPIGREGILRIDKSRFSVAGRQIPFNLMYDTGINKFDGLLDILVQNGIIQLKGSWYSYKDGKSFQRSDFINIVDTITELENVVV